MTIVAPGKGRAAIEQDGAGLRITIPARIYFFTTAISALFVPFSIFGAIALIYKIVAEPLSFGTAYLTFGLTAWTLGGLWNLNVLLWNLAGKEVIELDTTTLKRIKQIPFFSRSKEYRVASIANLRPAPAIPSQWYDGQNLSSLTFKEGTISFDYGRDTHHLGSGLDEAGAKYVTQEMCKRVRSLCS